MALPVVVSGVGYAPIARQSDRTALELATIACREAIQDAGLSADDIDGLTTYPERTSPPTPFQGPAIEEVQRAVGLHSLRYWQTFGTGAGQFGAILGGIYAVAGGGSRHLLTVRAHKRQDRAYLPNRPATAAAWGEEAYTAPYGASGGAARLAPWATRHMHEYGTTQDQLGAVVVNCRENAARNPRAYWQTAVTLQEYRDSRWVCTPFKLLDCDYPVEGAVALVISSATASHDSPHPPASVESVGHMAGPDSSWTTWSDYTRMASWYVADQLWASTHLRPSDVDVAELYDGFSWLAICWLEDMRFVKKGEGGSFFEEGKAGLDGVLPVCTDGGQLGMGRIHGYGKLAQAVLQLRGAAGNNQVSNAHVALACAGGGPQCAAILLTGGQT